jgi:hypothetical protein
MADRALIANVLLRNPTSGRVECFEAGQTLPAWAEGLVSNEGLFAQAKSGRRSTRSAATTGED